MVASAGALALAGFKSFDTKYNRSHNDGEAAAKAAYDAYMRRVEGHIALSFDLELRQNLMSYLDFEQYRVAAGLDARPLRPPRVCSALATFS